MTFAKEDMQARALAEQQVEADRVIEGLVVALNNDGDALLSKEEQTVILQAVEALITVRKGTDTQAIEDGIKHADEASQEFAARRMDASIRAALAGQSIDEV